MSKKIQFQKIPNTLKIALFILSLISIFFVLFSFYAYNTLNATSWNFGGMGMYTNIDYPGNRWLKITQVHKDSRAITNIDTPATRSFFFKEYESYLSLPTQKNAVKLAKKINIPHHDSLIEVWTFKYNSDDNSVQKILKTKHEVQGENFKKPI